MKIMALDMGTKRVGVALSDPLGLTAQGLTVLDRNPQAGFMASITNLVREHEVTRIVLGLPRRMDGSLGPEAQRVLAVANDLKALLGIEVVTWDERLSTVAAEKVLIAADVRRKKRKKVRDKVAAAYILQGYLDYINSSRPDEEA